MSLLRTSVVVSFSERDSGVMKTKTCPNCGQKLIYHAQDGFCLNQDCKRNGEMVHPYNLMGDERFKGIAHSLLKGINYSQVERDIDKAESELVAFGWVRQDLQDMSLYELGKLLERVKSGQIIPPKQKD